MLPTLFRSSVTCLTTLDIAIAAAAALVAGLLRSLAFRRAAGRRSDAMLAALRDLGRP